MNNKILQILKITKKVLDENPQLKKKAFNYAENILKSNNISKRQVINTVGAVANIALNNSKKTREFLTKKENKNLVINTVGTLAAMYVANKILGGITSGFKGNNNENNERENERQNFNSFGGFGGGDSAGGGASDRW